MARRRQAGNAFSLFAFQDIITSVTAIVILIMLILCIDFIQKKRTEAAASPAETIRQLEQQVRELEELASNLSLKLQNAIASPATISSSALEEELAKLESKKNELTDRLAEVRRTFDKVTQLAKEAEERRSEIDSQQELIKQFQERIAKLSQENEDLAQSNSNEAERLKKRKQELTQTVRTSTELIYNPVNDGTTQWLVEISIDGVVAMKLGTGAPLNLGQSLIAGSPLSNWINTLNSSSDYCLLLRRPSADTTLAIDLEDKLQERSIQHGLDLVGEDQVVRDGSHKL